ncbi:MAG: hypothetical protein VX666_03290, partial [Candidatus Thermoplasmatota archaeon]|nr:hypothetical protein [Candidatus Thermoplasmatota archaeon]
MVKPIECASTPTFEAASTMSDTPPPPSGLPPPPPPPLPPGFGVDDEEDEFSDVIEEEMDVESEEEIVSELQDELPPPPPPGFDPLHRSFTGFDSSPPSPPEFDDADEEEEEVWDVDELDIQSFDDTLTSLEQMPEAEEDGVEEAEEEVEDWNAALDRAFVTEAEEDSKGSSEEVSQIALSSNLRPAAEVDSIPGDKLYVTLREKEESVLNPDGTVRQQSIDGELILRNSSRKDRAWDIEVLLQNTDSTDIGGGAITVRELDATQTTNLPYTASGPRMLILREHIDTEPERPQESSLSMIFSEHSQEILIRLSVENIAPVSLTDVVVRRALPENFELVDGPEYDIKDNELVWRIGRLPVGESASLEILPRVTTRTIQRFATGTVSAAYSCEATVSRAQFDSVNSRARQFGYVSPKEDDRPDVFHCKLVVENRSSFVVGLSGATVWLAGRSEPFLDMEDIREDIPPEGLWDSIEKRIEAIDKPNFTHEINYSILPRANVESTGILELKERSFKVLDAEVNKQYSISRIRSYVASDLDCITVVENTGSAPINVMRLLDDIPGIFN